MADAKVFIHNDFASIPQDKLTIQETHLFFAIVSQINFRGTEIIKVTFNTLRELLDYKDEAIFPLADVAREMNRKLNETVLPPSLSETGETFRPFDIFEISKDDSSLKIQVSRRFAYLFNVFWANR